MKKQVNLMKVCNAICVFLMLSLLICQFIPFWQHEGEVISIQEYVWFPVDNEALTNYFKDEVSADHTVDSILVMPLLVLAAGALGVAFGMIKSDEIWGAIFAVVCGAAGIYGFLAKPVFRLGNAWQIQFAFSVALFVLAVFAVVYWKRHAVKQK